MSEFSKDLIVAALAGEFDSLAAIGDAIEGGAWDLPTDCPGWSVRDMLSHVIGTERMLLGEKAPDVEVSGEHLRNPIGESNERWIEARRSLAGTDIVAELREVCARRLEVLRAMSQGDFDAASWTPAGQATYGRFMRIRVFDCWMHEQDMRSALGRPGHDSGPIVALCLDEIAASLPFVVGKKAGAHTGQSVRFELTGPAARRIDVVVADRAALGTIGADPTVTVSADTVLFTRLVGGRTDAGGALERREVTIDGDAQLAANLVAGLAYMI